MEFDYVEQLKAAEFHWFFVQGEQALASDLYVPGAASLIAGVEASIRSTLHRLDGRDVDDDLGATLSNSLLRVAASRGLPVQALSFPGETDLLVKVQRREPYAEIVRIRHNLAHGNIMEYVNREFGIFTPECLRDLSRQLVATARRWARDLGQFRQLTLP